MIRTRNTAGFTLIELVVVIIILAILAVVAAPKFIGLKSEALTAAIYDMQGQLKAANQLVFSKAALEGKEALAFQDIHNQVGSWIILDGKKVSLNFGHIQGSSWNIEQVMNIDAADWTVLSTAGVFAQAYLTPRGAPAFGTSDIQNIEQSQCYLKYAFSKKQFDLPGYEVVTTGC